MSKRLFFVAALLALFLLQFGDCMAAMNVDGMSMECCGSMPCTPANQSQGCCKNMTSAETPGFLPAGPVSLHAPVVATVAYPRDLAVVWPSPAPRADDVEIQPHSPPDLYTLHASLLI